MARVSTALTTFLVFALCATGCSKRPVPPAVAVSVGDVFPALPEVRAEHGVARLQLDAVADAGGAPRFSYLGNQNAAPTIRIAPGDTIDLTLRNRLPKLGATRNDVNIHFHGLTVSPNAPADDSLMTLARPGQTLHYLVKVPRDQQPGLYWYHPHSHGEAYRQVTAGMSGAIIVEGLERHYPALARMKERVIVLREIALQARYLVDDDATARPGATPAPHASAGIPSGGILVTPPPSDHDPCRSENGLAPTLNGERFPKIAILPGERQFFRVVNASAARHFDLSIVGSRLELVALDGVALDAYPGSHPTALVSHVVVPPAGRAEFVVTGLSHTTVLQSACFDSGSAGDANPIVTLANIIDPRVLADTASVALEGSGIAAAAASERDPVVPSLSRAAGAALLRRPAANRTIVFSEDANGFYIDHKSFDMDAPPAITAHAGTTEEWTIKNESDEVHDFHIHQIHFAAERIGGVDVAQRHWQDTIVVRPRSSVRLLMDFRDPIVRGTFLYHCHILDHEDHGMMAKIRVI